MITRAALGSDGRELDTTPVSPQADVGLVEFTTLRLA